MKLTEILQLCGLLQIKKVSLWINYHIFNLPEKGDSSSLEIDRIERIECKDLV